MRMKLALCAAVCGFSLALLTNSAFGQLYTENFDDGLAVNRWTAFPGRGFTGDASATKPIDTNFDREPFFPNVDGINDNFDGFAFDYSTVGIPSAPNSTGGSTTGLKLQANLFSAALGGFSVSPNGLDLRTLTTTGNYVVKFDHWANTVGPMPVGGNGSTNVSTFGILTAGIDSESLLSVDGVFFGYTADGESSADYRAYSIEDQNSYDGTVAEPHAIYHAGTRNIPGALTTPPNPPEGTPGAGVALYNQAFGTGVTVPASQTALFPNQTGTLNSGAAGFQWNAIEIRKIGNLVEWWANDVKLITVDMTDFATPTAGGNISFGHADINATSSTDPNDTLLLFSLVDNIRVEELPGVGGDNPDFDGDGDYDGRDFLIWQRGFGRNDFLTPEEFQQNGDADGDQVIDGNDLLIWQDYYVNGPPGPLSSLGSVPEPTSLVSLLGGLMAFVMGRRRALNFATVRGR